MHLKTIGGLAAALLLAAACDSYPSSEPPPEIAEACLFTMMGMYQLPASEWVKPLTDEGKGTWQVSPDHGVIFRGERFNPLNETTSVTSILLVPQQPPPNAKPYCKGYYEVSRVDLDGIEQPLAPFFSELVAAHYSVLAKYPSERLTSDQPLTLDYYQ